MSKPMTDFTVVVPHWEPRVTPVALSEATEEQLAANGDNSFKSRNRRLYVSVGS